MDSIHSRIRTAFSSSSPATASNRRPAAATAEVLLAAHHIRVARGDYNTAKVHLADAIELLIAALAAVALGRPLSEEPVLARRVRGSRLRSRHARR